MIAIEERLSQLGLALQPAPAACGAYESVVIHDGIAYVSGQVSRIGEAIIAGLISRDPSPDVIERASGLRYADFAATRLWQPLELRNDG